MTPIVTTEKINNPTPPLFHQLTPGTYFVKDFKWTSVIYRKKIKVSYDDSNAIIISHNDPQFVGVHDTVRSDTEVFPLKALEIQVKYSI